MKTKVLFLCTGNSARSQMAEAFLRHYAGERFEAFSAGLEPKGLHPLTLRVMEEIGIGMSEHTSKDLKQYIGKVNFGFLITVCDRAEKNCPFFPGMGIRLHWEFEDPAAFHGKNGEKPAKFREIRDLIDTQVRAWLKEQGIVQVETGRRALPPAQ